MPVRGLSDTRTSARQGGGREQRGAKRLGSERGGTTRERLYAATRGKAGKRLAFGVTLYNPLTHLAGTPIPHTHPADTPIPHITLGICSRPTKPNLSHLLNASDILYCFAAANHP